MLRTRQQLTRSEKKSKRFYQLKRDSNSNMRCLQKWQTKRKKTEEKTINSEEKKECRGAEAEVEEEAGDNDIYRLYIYIANSTNYLIA